MTAPYNVLFLCTGNSARSIMAEGILNRKGKDHFHAFSAGSHPSGTVRPEALKQLELAGIATEGMRSKSWDEFAPSDAAVHGTPDEIARAFRDAFTILDRRISLFLALPLATLEQLAIQRELDSIGKQ